MLINICYVFSFLLLFCGVLVVNKKEDNICLFDSGVICTITVLCIDAFAALPISIVGIPVELRTMGMVNFVFGVCIWIKVILQRKVQKYRISLYDFFSFGILTIGFALIFIHVFTLDIKNVYVNSDPIVHFSFALNVLQTKKISAMYFAELFNGLFLEFFAPFIAEVNLYKAFILADSFSNVLNVMMFFVLAKLFAKSKEVRFALPFCCFLYFLGWPFFSYVLGGFVYFGWGALLFMYIIFLLLEVDKVASCERQLQLKILFCIVLGCFSLTVCYMLFVPVVVIVLLSCARQLSRYFKVVWNRKLVLRVVFGSLILFLIVFCIAFFGFFHGDITYIFQALSTDGWIHKDLYKDFLPFFPAYLYMHWKLYKHNTKEMLYTITGSLLCCILFFFFCCLLGVMSPYYYYKFYYLLWIVMWLVFIDAMEYFWRYDKSITVIYSATVLLPMILTLSGGDAWLAKKEIVFDERGNRHYTGIMSLLDRNEHFLSGTEQNYEDKDALIDIYVELQSKYDSEQITLISADGVGCSDMWYEQITGCHSIAVTSRTEYEEALETVFQQNDKVLIHENSELFRQCIDVVEDYEVILSNGYYGLYLKK